MSLLDYWGTNRLSAKRRKTDDDGSKSPDRRGDQEAAPRSLTTPVGADPDDEGSRDEPPSSQTDLESSLPAVQSDNEAIEEYESSHTAEYDEKRGLHERLQDGKWQKGKNSIYVDAFNLALETVLSEEAHLFDEAEMEVFRQWRGLSYEAQYLYGHLAMYEKILIY